MTGVRLFIGSTTAEVARSCEEAANRAVATFTEAELLANSLDQLAEAVIADKVAHPITLMTQNRSIGTEVVALPERRGLTVGNIYMPNAAIPAREALKASLYIPYTGTQQAFAYRPSRMPPTTPPEATLTGRHVVLSIITDPGTAVEVVEKQLLVLEENLQQWVTEVNADIATLDRQIRALVRDMLASRIGMLQQRDAMAAAFTIPVRPVDPDRALEIPVRRTAVVLKSSPSAPVGPQEWSLADAVYEQMITTITRFGHALERRPASGRLLLPDEETLRDWLMFLLSTNYEAPDGSELFVGGETVNGRGKTDILIRHQDRNAFIGECKFWRGQKKFGEAIDQLLGYTVWRDTKAAIILFITRLNATAAIDSAGECLAGHSQCRQAKMPDDSARRRDYVFASPHDGQRAISIALLPVVVPRADKGSGLPTRAGPHQLR
jgi:hypothetical protein